MNTDGPLSEIARSVLVDKAAGDVKSFREKAGLLALLNLLGIVEAFYGVVPAEDDGATAIAVRDPAVDALIKAPAGESEAPPPAHGVPAPSSPPVGPISIVSGLSKLLGSMQPPAGAAGAQAEPGSAAAPQTGGSPISSLLSNLDPALIASVLGVVASMARARPARAPIKVEAQSAESAPGESGTPAAEPEPSPEAAPPSPLQQLLGIDPKVITLVLNVLAELMKSRQAAEQKDKPAAGQAAGATGEARAEQSVARPASEARSHPPATARKSALRPHKPGLGIYRSPRFTARSALQSPDG